MPEINIRRVNGVVVFEPANLSAVVDDSVVWRNLDPEAQHWITKQGGAHNLWFPHAMAPFREGRDPNVTPSTFFISSPRDIDYVCSIHGERGKITVSAENPSPSPAPPASPPPDAIV